MKKTEKIKNITRKANSNLAIFTVLVMFICLISFKAQALICNDSYGTTIIGVNGVTYCASKKGYKNYYAAEAWCQSIDGHLINLKNDCGGIISGSGKRCENLKGRGDNNWYWTNSYYNANYNLLVNLSDGVVLNNFQTYNYYFHRRYSDSYHFAICR